MEKAERIKNLLKLLKEREIDSLLVTSLPNIRYLSGFTGSWANCLVSGRGCFLFIDFRYRLQARKEVKGFRVLMVEGETVFSSIVEKVKGLDLKTVAFEAGHLSYKAYLQLKKASGRAARLIPSTALVERLRMLKDKGEIKLLRKLGRMTDRVLTECRRHMKKDVTERELLARLEELARSAGAEGVAFPPIIASGTQSAMPHYRSGKGRLISGRPLLIDFGLKLDGYNSDLTRTFHLGKLSGRYRKIYSAVLNAQQLAIQRVKPGVTAGEVDACARAYLDSEGFGEFFGHGLGHGIGLEVHEEPRLNKLGKARLEPGMVFSVEPGVYIPGWGGVRIEDLILVKKNGYSVLTSSNKGLEDSVL